MSSGYYLGIDLGGTNVKSGVVDGVGNVIARDSRPTEAKKGLAHSIDQIVACARASVSDSGLLPGDLEGVGIGSPGPIDPYEGTAVSPVNLPTWEVVPLAALLSDAFGGLPTCLDNDANVVAYGENWLGAGKHTRHFICITLGTGVGGGVVSNGQLIHGFDGNAGEIGHMSIDYRGRPCPCGNLGCLERYCSATAVVETAQEILAGNHGMETALEARNGLTSELIADAAQNGDAVARMVFEEAGVCLGMSVVSLIAAFNANVVAIGGGMARAGDLILDPVRRTVRRHALAHMKEVVKITPMLLGEDAALLGAAKLAMDGGVGAAS